MIKLAWKNIVSNPFGSILSITLVALSVGLVIFFSHVNRQFQRTMESNTAGVHLILAAKGSPLQTVLCNLYHIDNPTGNISIDEVKAFFNPKHPLIDKAVPLSIGDSYRSHRIVGTTKEFAELYNLNLQEGNWWLHSLEVVAGHRAARNLNLKIGSTFKSSHGLIEDGMDHTHDDDFHVVGILDRSGTVADNLLLTSFETVWQVHEGHSHAHDEEHDHGAHDHSAHHHYSNERELLLANPEKDITSVLMTFKNQNHQTLNMMRSINENSTVQAAHPAWELNRLYSMVGTGTKMLTYLAWLIGIVSIISIFLSLLQSLRSRKYELALIRVLGASPGNVSTLIVVEGLIQVLIGVIIGILFAHIGLLFVDTLIQDAYRYNLTAWKFGNIEMLVAVVAILLGIVSALWPAWLAYRTDVSKTLQRR